MFLKIPKPEKIKLRFLRNSNLIEITDGNGNSRIVEIDEPELFLSSFLENQAHKFSNNKVIDRSIQAFWQKK